MYLPKDHYKHYLDNSFNFEFPLSKDHGCRPHTFGRATALELLETLGDYHNVWSDTYKDVVAAWKATKHDPQTSVTRPTSDDGDELRYAYLDAVSHQDGPTVTSRTRIRPDDIVRLYLNECNLSDPPSLEFDPRTVSYNAPRHPYYS
jgi:hypothetical protein